MKNSVLIVGFLVVLIANLLADKLNEKVVVFDSKKYIARNCYDYIEENSITTYKYDPRNFYTINQRVFGTIFQNLLISIHICKKFICRRKIG